MSHQYCVSQSKSDLTKDFCLRADSLFDRGEYHSCVPIYQEVSSITQNSQVEKFLYCQNRIAESYTREGKLDESLMLAENTLKLCSDNYLEQKGDIYNTIGVIYLEKGRHDLAEENFQKALTLFSKGRIKTESLAKTYTNLGLSFLVSENYELAEEHMTQALQIRKEIFGNEHTNVAASYNNLGLVVSTYDPKSALDYYNQALKIYKEKYIDNHPNIAISYTNIGFIERKLGNTSESLKSFEKALQLWQTIFNTDHPNVAFVYSNLGQSYLESEQYNFALENFEKALGIYKSNYGENHPKIASTYNSIAIIFDEQKKYSLALSNFQNAICANIANYSNKNIYSNPSLAGYYNADILLASLQLKARTLEKLHYEKTLKVNDLTTGLDTYIKCDSLLDKIRQVRTSKNDKIELGRIGSEIYEEAISIALTLSDITLRKKKYNNKAFYFSEKNKSAVLLGAIADAKAKSFAGIPDSLLEKEKNLTDNISFYEQKLAEGPSEEKEKSIREELFVLHRDYEALIKNLETTFPNYYNLKYNINTLSIKDIQKTIDSKTAVLTYSLSESKNRIYIFYISKNKYKVYNLPKNETFNKDLVKFRNAIKLRIGDLYTSLAHSIYKSLLPSGIPNKIKKLAIIPDGRLGNIPFETLLTDKIKTTSDIDYATLPYLVKKYAISYDYSCSLLLESIKNSSKNDLEKNSILVYAPVNFDPEKNLSSLEGTAIEAEKITTTFTNNQLMANSLVYEKASEENLKTTKLEKYNIIHFATHGIVNEDKPELSQIFLSKNESSWEDGNLFSGEIYNLKINSDLVVLSACQTGLGKVKKGEGVIGLTRALLYAGANNLIVSLWSVSDKSTSELMIDFYSILLQSHPDYSIALQQSKLKMINSGNFSHPYYWAPFIFIGK
jgi:CHAT domain-containing protein/Tfp pilus assembly protein PilF